MTRTQGLFIGISYACLLVQDSSTLLWDVMHPDPLHSQFPILIRLLLTIPALTLAAICAVQIVFRGDTLHKDGR